MAGIFRPYWRFPSPAILHVGAGVGGGGGGPTLTYIGSADYQGSSTAANYSLNIGTMAANSLLIVAAACQTTLTTPTMTVGGASMTRDVVSTSDGSDASIWSLYGTAGGSGTVTIALTATGTGFQVRDIFVWRIDGATSSTVVTTGTGNATTASLATTAGNFVFATTTVSTAGTTWSGSTVAPTANLGPPTSGAYFAAYWDKSIVPTNASFGCTHNNGNSDTAAAQYA